MVKTLPELLQARYGTSAPRLGSDAETLLNPTVETLLEHRSVRKFLDAPITDDELVTMVAAAQSASSSSSLQAWSVIAVRDQAKRDRIAAGCGASGSFISEAPLLLVWVIDFARAASIMKEAGVTTNTFDLIETTALGFTDIGIASQNALLAAESMGLGGCYLGSLRNDIPGVVETLKLPKYVFPAVGLSIGHPDPSEGTGVKPRLPQSVVVHHDTYDASTWQHAKEYDEDFGAYYASQGVPDARWTRTIAKRLSDSATLHGREKLREHLATQGFESK